MRTHSRAILGATALTLLTAVGGCGSGGPSTYLVNMLQSTDAGPTATVLTPPGR